MRGDGPDALRERPRGLAGRRQGDPRVANQLSFDTAPLFVPGDPVPVVYTNVGTEPVTMGVAELGGTSPGSFRVASDCPAVLAVDATCTVNVRFAPEVPSGQSATLTQSTDALRSGHRTPLAGTGQAVPVDNDSPAKAIAFSSLPFGHGGTTYGLAGSGGWIACPGDYEALWYTFTSPTKRIVRFEVALGNAALSVQPSPSGMFIACGINQPVTMTAEAGVTYWIKVQRRYPGAELLGLKATAGPADTEVAATGIGINRSTFYPVVDGYLDTVTLRGTRNEKAAVAAAIYAPTGGKVRSLTAASALGAYAIAWNGKTTAGAVVPAGRYRVVQTVTDLWGNHMAVTAYVNVSRKKLYTYTYSKTLNGAAYSATGTCRGGLDLEGEVVLRRRGANRHRPARQRRRRLRLHGAGRHDLQERQVRDAGPQQPRRGRGSRDRRARTGPSAPAGTTRVSTRGAAALGCVCMGRDQGAGHPARVVDAPRPRVRGGVDVRRDQQVGGHPRRPRHGGLRES